MKEPRWGAVKAYLLKMNGRAVETYYSGNGSLRYFWI